MQPASIRARALPVQVLPGRGHAGVPDQRAGQVRRPRGERAVLIGDGEADRVSITPQPDGKRQCRSCQTLRLLNTFFRHSPPAENEGRCRFPKSHARMSEALCRTRELLIW
jgi:hypothetical protein